MSNSKKECPSEANSEENEPEPIYEVVDVGAQCDEEPHLQHTDFPETTRKSEVCTLDPPPVEDDSTKCGKESRNAVKQNEQKMECKVVEDHDNAAPSACDDSPKVPKCEKKKGK